MKKYIYILAVLIGFNIATAQEIRYVNANNGLFLRDTPSQDSKRLDKLAYGTALEITERTNLRMDVKDNGEIISGEWVKISSKDNYLNGQSGYVFDGFLTENRLKKRFKIGFEDFTVEIDDLEASIIGDPQTTVHKSNHIDVDIEFGENLKNRILRIKHHTKYKSVKVFQKHENSITIAGNDTYCDLANWKHYYSSWQPLKSTKKENAFKTISYNNKAKQKFVKVDINAFKNAVKIHCGEDCFKLIKDDKQLENNTTNVSISKVYFKVIFTTVNDEKIEKIIAFDMPRGC